MFYELEMNESQQTFRPVLFTYSGKPFWKSQGKLEMEFRGKHE